MNKIFVAIYDNASKVVPFCCYHSHSTTVYRTANMGFVESLSKQGLEPTAIFLEEDIEDLMQDRFSHEDVTEQDVTFLKNHLKKWSLA